MRQRLAVSIMAAGMLLPDISFAYVGPGAGLTAIGTILAFVFAAILSIIGFIWYPIKRILRKRNKPSTDVTSTSAEAGSQSEDRELP
jgi:hypothetical protein